MEKIKELTKNRITCEGQSLYRALRRHHKNGLIEFELQEGNKGPDRKYYTLTPMGREILKEFTQKYVRIFYNKNLAKMLFGTS
jgi:DNA-binding PadR family transcriptional regulator